MENTYDHAIMEKTYNLAIMENIYEHAIMEKTNENTSDVKSDNNMDYVDEFDSFGCEDIQGIISNPCKIIEENQRRRAQLRMSLNMDPELVEQDR